MKDNVKRVKRQATDWEKLFAKDRSDIKDCYLNTQRTLKNSAIRKQTTWLKYVPKLLIDTSPKKIHNWKTSIRKDALLYMSLEICKLKQQWNITIYLLEWPKSRTLMPDANAGENVEQQMNAHSLLVGMQNDTATLKTVWQFLT